MKLLASMTLQHDKAKSQERTPCKHTVGSSKSTFRGSTQDMVSKRNLKGLRSRFSAEQGTDAWKWISTCEVTVERIS